MAGAEQLLQPPDRRLVTECGTGQLLGETGKVDEVGAVDDQHGQVVALAGHGIVL
ncbi:hypothetical protein [Amycolatopsis suaedae]|uniref:hypothetical protein n=1 Tax=Amycolatopsis suaedae TaxID=2510978 RepID=UPI0013EF13F2|nr:hypothetical protein [Amycolatopsis suaedae]